MSTASDGILIPTQLCADAATKPWLAGGLVSVVPVYRWFGRTDTYPQLGQGRAAAWVVQNRSFNTQSCARAQVFELSEMKKISKNYGPLLHIRMFIEVVATRPRTVAFKLTIRNSTEHFSWLFVNILRSREADAQVRQ